MVFVSTKYQVSLIIITFLLVVCVFMGTSYSLWSITLKQTDDNSIATTCFNIDYVESGNISLSNAYPMSDSKGLQMTPYTFTVTNTCDVNSKMSLRINVLNTSTMDDASIKVAYLEGSNSVSTPSLLTSFNKLESVQSNDSNAVRSYEITTNNLGYNVSKTYKVYLWMDENVGNSQMGTTFNARIGVVNLATS